MTKEIRHVVTKNRFAWSVDDIILPLLELWLLYYLAHRGYTNLQTDTGLFDQIQDVLLMIIPLTGAGFWIARLWQLNAFTVIETPLNTEENFLFVLDRVKMFHISKREFDRWNFCVGIRAGSEGSFLPFWLTVICYENKIYINERPTVYALSLWWRRAGAEKMIADVQALADGGKENADREIERIREEMAHHEAAVAAGEKAPIDPWERNLVQDPAAPAFYSRDAVRIFSFLFTPLVGCALLATNVQASSKVRVMLWGIAITSIMVIIFGLLPRSALLICIVNSASARFIADNIWNRYVSKDIRHRERSAWTLFMICLVIMLPIVWYYFSGS